MTVFCGTRFQGGVLLASMIACVVTFVFCFMYSLTVQEITVTNYTGAARDYLKKLIQVMGGKFTPSMSQSNKVLVAG